MASASETPPQPKETPFVAREQRDVNDVLGADEVADLPHEVLPGYFPQRDVQVPCHGEQMCHALLFQKAGRVDGREVTVEGSRHAPGPAKGDLQDPARSRG